jgi:hypothetical protein
VSAVQDKCRFGGARKGRDALRRWLPILLVAVALTGCSKQQKIRSALIDAGIPPPMADCMAREMAEHLSTDELRTLSRVEDVAKGNVGQWTLVDYVDAARRIGDPKVVAIVGAAAAYCSAISRQR